MDSKLLSEIKAQVRGRCSIEQVRSCALHELRNGVKRFQTAVVNGQLTISLSQRDRARHEAHLQMVAANQLHLQQQQQQQPQAGNVNAAAVGPAPAPPQVPAPAPQLAAPPQAPQVDLVPAAAEQPRVPRPPAGPLRAARPRHVSQSASDSDSRPARRHRRRRRNASPSRSRSRSRSRAITETASEPEAEAPPVQAPAQDPAPANVLPETVRTVHIALGGICATPRFASTSAAQCLHR